MASLKSEKLHPFIPVEDDKFPGSVLMRGLEVGGGMKLLQYYYFNKAFCTCFFQGTTTEHLTEGQFCHSKLNDFLLLLSALSPIKGPHMPAPAHKNAFRKELWSKLPGSTENGSLDTGSRRFGTARVCACGGGRRWAEYSGRAWISVLLQVTCLCLRFLQCEIIFICIYLLQWFTLICLSSLNFIEKNLNCVSKKKPSQLD